MPQMITIGKLTLPAATPEQLALNVHRWRMDQARKAKIRAQKATLKARITKGNATVGEMVVQQIKHQLEGR